jgi:hypothetical protein
MKRFLGVLIASMFLASAAYAADDMSKDTKEKKADGETKGDAKAKNGKTKDSKAKAKDGDAKTKGEKADKPADTK